MRPFALPDLNMAARVLLTMPEGERPKAMRRLIRQAEAADWYRKRLGRAHPLWGNGSIEAVARSQKMVPPQQFSNTDYLACMALALRLVVEHRRANLRVALSCA